MEQLFAVKVLLHYHDKPKVDHLAIHRLLSAAEVESLRIIRTDGTSISLVDHINTHPSQRKNILEVIGSRGTALTQVAFIFMLAEARAAADTIAISPGELETVCMSLERLLGCLVLYRDVHPIRYWGRMARTTKLGTPARRRSLHHVSDSSTNSKRYQVSILKAVNAVLRLCDVATHCLAVVSRQSVASRAVCETAVNLSTRLLTLAESLCEVQDVDISPALSFFSSNSLRTALVTGAMHLGTITVEHPETEPMPWTHLANRIVVLSSTYISPRTSIISALFGGMIQAGKKYESSERDGKAAEGALCMLSTLHMMLESDISKDSTEETTNSTSHVDSETSTAVTLIPNPSSQMQRSAPISQAARSFLGERVVAAEEDGDEGRIAARTIYQACEEYAERAGEINGIIGLLISLFTAAGRQCRQESVDDTIISVCEGNVTFAPDESDASSDGSHLRSEGQQFPIDVFEQRSKDGFVTGATFSSTSEAGIEHTERSELHREIGTLTLDILAHWISRSHMLGRYADLDISDVLLTVCRSAATFTFTNSSASYDLRAAMIDFGSSIRPIWETAVQEKHLRSSESQWKMIVESLIRSCGKATPILTNLLEGAETDAVVICLIDQFLERGCQGETSFEAKNDDCHSLPVENLFSLLLTKITLGNGILVVSRIVDCLMTPGSNSPKSDLSLMFYISSLMLVGHCSALCLGIPENEENLRIACATLFRREHEGSFDPVLPDVLIEVGGHVMDNHRASDSEISQQLRSLLQRVFPLVLRMEEILSANARKELMCVMNQPNVFQGAASSHATTFVASERGQTLCYHLFWSFLFLQRAMVPLCLNFPQSQWQSQLNSPHPRPIMLIAPFPNEDPIKLIDQVSATEDRPDFTMAFIAESTALGQTTGISQHQDEISISCLKLLLRTVINSVSEWLYDDPSSNFLALQESFSGRQLQEIISISIPELNTIRGCFGGASRGDHVSSCLRLGMSYLRNIGSQRISDLLCQLMLTCCHLLLTITPAQIEDIRDLLRELCGIILFLPESHSDLQHAMNRFILEVEKLTDNDCMKNDDAKNDNVLLLYHVCGFCNIADRNSLSTNGIQLLSTFVHKLGSEENEKQALRMGLRSKTEPETINTLPYRMLHGSLPRFSLEKMLSVTLVPEDEAAVAVSAHAHSLELLTKASNVSHTWRTAILSALHKLVVDANSDFPHRMIRRSVMLSATMSEALVLLTTEVLGTSDSILAVNILENSFNATKSILCEENDLRLDAFVRLFNFAIHTTICFGKVRAKCQSDHETTFLEGRLFDLILDVLRRTTTQLDGHLVDNSSIEISHFLCGLIDAVRSGLFGLELSYFSNFDGETLESTNRKDMRGSNEIGSKDDNRGLSSTPISPGSPTSQSGDSERNKPKLCTFTETGNDFVDQPWYFCYSCDLAGQKGVCAVCAKLCHKGCELAYSKRSRFFCDCGADSMSKNDTTHAAASSEDGDGSVATPTNPQSHPFHRIHLRKPRSCQCLRSSIVASQTTTHKKHIQLIEIRDEVSPTHERERRLSAQSQQLLKTELNALRQAKNHAKSRTEDIQREFKTRLGSSETMNSLISSSLRMLEELDGSFTYNNSAAEWKSLDKVAKSFAEHAQSKDFVIQCKNAQVAKSTRLFKAGTLDIATAQSPRDGKRTGRGSLLSYAPQHQVLAVTEKSGYIEFIDASDILLPTETAKEKNTSPSFRRISPNFVPVDISFHPENPNLLLVTGRSKINVLCRNQQGDGFGWTPIEVEIGLTEYEGSNGSNELISASWIEGYATLLLVVTENFLKIFDVSADAFCPCFFTRTPQLGTVSEDETNPSDGPKITICSATVSLERSWQECFPIFFVLILTSNGFVSVTRAKYNESSSPTFHVLLDLGFAKNENQSEVIADHMSYNRGDSILSIAFKSGNVLCTSVMFRIREEVIEAAIAWMHMYHEATTGSGDFSITQITGTEFAQLFYRNQNGLSSAGIGLIGHDKRMQVQSFSGNTSSAIVGITQFSPSILLGEPRTGGGFFVLDDGSLHRVDLLRGRLRPQVSEVMSLTEIIKQRQVREQKAQQRRIGGTGGYNPLPDPIGFFENCRPVCDNITFESPDVDQYPGFNFQQMAVILAGSGDKDFIISPKENQPFKFSAQVENESVVLIGARIQFGGTEQSKNRIPTDVKVFGRPVRWFSQNGRKRWLDIPFSIPESSASPRKVSFEFFPRRKIEDRMSDGDGFLAIDSLRLYSISDVDFAERKAVFEKQKAEHIETKRSRRHSSDMHSRYKSEFLQSWIDGNKRFKSKGTYSQGQAAILTILSCIDDSIFLQSPICGKLIIEVNNLWSTSGVASASRTEEFLKEILSPLITLCNFQLSAKEDETQNDEQKHLSCAYSISSAVQNEMELIRQTALSNASSSQIVRIEKVLFTVAGLARGTLAAGCNASSFPKDAWIDLCTKLLPTDLLLARLFSSFYSLYNNDRILFNCDYRSLMNAVDIMLTHLAKVSLTAAEVQDKTVTWTPLKVIVDMMCSSDRLRRLFISQRILSTMDSMEDSVKAIASPVERLYSSSIAEELKSVSGDRFYKNKQNDPQVDEEDSDTTERWAYRCDNCNKVCDQEWWHCYDCEDFDLCTSCLRKSLQDEQQSHVTTHILLRGTTEEDAFDYESSSDSKYSESLQTLNQLVMKPLADEMFVQIQKFNHKSNSLHLVEMLETIAEAIGPNSPPALRSSRLNALFGSSFVDVLLQKTEAVECEIESTNSRPFSMTSALKECEVLYLLLRILLSAPTSVMPIYIHRHSIPVVLFRLVERMHKKLSRFSEFFTQPQSLSHRSASRRDLIPVSTWNQSIPGVRNSLLPDLTSNQCNSYETGKMLVADGLPLEEGAFMCILLEILKVLDYAYRSAASAPIASQMTALPRKVLCDIINFCHTPSSHSVYGYIFKETSAVAANVLSAIAMDDADALNSILDKYLYEEESKQLKQTMSKCRQSGRHISYKTTVEIARILQSLHSSASSHPNIWTDYASTNKEVLLEIYSSAKTCVNELQTKALQLLATGFALEESMAKKTIKSQSFVQLEQSSSTDDSDQQKSKGEEDTSMLSYSTLIELSRKEPKPYHSLYESIGQEVIEFLILRVMLSSQSKSSRLAAAQVLLLGMAREGAHEKNLSFISCIHQYILRGIEIMPYVGNLADGFIQCVEFFIHCCQNRFFGPESSDLLHDVTERMFSLLKQSCSALVSHPNARLYVKLASIVHLEGYYLESEPCMTCAGTTWESSESREFRVDSIRAETKHTDSVIVHRLLSFHEISELSVKVIEPRRTRRVKKIEVYYSSKVVSDGTELKRADHPWQRLQALELSTSSTEAKIELLVPITCANLKFEFAEFHSLHDTMQVKSGDSQDQDNAPLVGSQAEAQPSSGNGSRGVDSLQCPRCSRSVTDRHGICRNCHENAYQCRQCRNINYENLDGFLCNECGFCKHARFEFFVTGRLTHVVEPILNEEDRRGASKVIEKETENVQRCIEQLTRIRSSLLRSLSYWKTNEDTGDRFETLNGTTVGLADLLDPGSSRTDVGFLEAFLEGQVSRDIEETVNSAQGGVSITEEVIADSNASGDHHERDQSQRTARESPSTSNGNEGPEKASLEDNNLLNRDTSSVAAQYTRECKAIFSTMSRGIRILAMTRAELIRYANTVGGQRLQLARDLAHESVNDDVSREHTDLHGFFRPDHTTFRCYGCTQSFISKCVELAKMIIEPTKSPLARLRYIHLPKDLMVICSLCDNKNVQYQIREIITLLVRDNEEATRAVFNTIEQKVKLCISLYETVDTQSVVQFEMALLEHTASLNDSCWEERLRVVMRVLLTASNRALQCSSLSETIILPCLRVALRLLRVDEEKFSLDAGSAEDLSKPPGEDIVPIITETDDIEVSELEREELNTVSFETESIGDELRSSQTRDPSFGSQPLQSERLESNDLSMGNISDSVSDRARSTPRNSQRNTSLTPPSPQNLDGKRLEYRNLVDGIAPSSGPSSVSAGVEGRTSDEESTPIQASDLDLSQMDTILENNHDLRTLTANVSEWLNGEFNQAQWMLNLKRDMLEEDRREKQPTNSSPSLRLLFNRWKRLTQTHGIEDSEQTSSRTKNPEIQELQIGEENWLLRLILFSPCVIVRKEACNLLKLLCGKEEVLQLQTVDMLIGPALTLASEIDERSREYFDLLEEFISQKVYRMYLLGKGFLLHLGSLICAKAQKLILAEVEAESSLRLVNCLEGFSLKRMINLLRLVIEVVPPTRTHVRQQLFNAKNNAIVSSLQRAYVCVRKLISLRTKLTDECGSLLSEILISRTFLCAESTISAVVSSCVTELQEANKRNDAQAVAILLDELCLMLCPERKKPTCHLILNKAPTQEEFIRGSMLRNPYPSSSFDGPLMRDVKNKICTDLDLPGLIDDEFAMELLVAGKLIKFDLPIMSVYEHIWRGSAAEARPPTIQTAQISRAFAIRRTSQVSRTGGVGSRSAGLRGTILSIRRLNSDRISNEDETKSEPRNDPPMVVTYRLSGLDGEATEEIIDALPNDNSGDENAEELYKDTIVLGQVGGLDVLFKLLSVVGSWGDDAETAVRAPALRLLRASCEVAQNRALLAKSPHAVSTVLDCAASAFEHAIGSPVAIASAESLLIAAEKILAQQIKESERIENTDTKQISHQNPGEIVSRVSVFLKRLEFATSTSAQNSILHLLPFLMQGTLQAIQMVLDHFNFSWESLDEKEEDQRMLWQLGTVLFATPNDNTGRAFVSKAISDGFADKCVEYLTSKFPLPRPDHKQTWNVSLNQSAPPLVLRIMTSLAQFLDSTRNCEICLDLRSSIMKNSSLIPSMCQLEMAVSSNAIGSTAEELLEAYSKDQIVLEHITKERQVIRQARREAAQAFRAAALREAGLASAFNEAPSKNPKAELQASKMEQKVQTTEVMQLLEEVPDEIGPSCVVCGDGFLSRPEEALTAYVFCRRVPLEMSTDTSSKNRSKNEATPTIQQHSVEYEWETWSQGRNRGQGNNGKPGGASCYTTVTHFNCIHLGCHKDAARVDRGSRRDEWDGAALRNSQTKCNNMFPIRPPAALKSAQEAELQEKTRKTANESYTEAVEEYFGRLNSLGRINMPQTKVVMCDIARSLIRFADGRSVVFSEHAKGGGPHSNAILLPHLIQLAMFTIEASNDEAKDQFKNNHLKMTKDAITKYIEEDEPGDVAYFLSAALVLFDLNTWRNSILKFISRGFCDGNYDKPLYLRLILVCDLANTLMKKDINCDGEDDWLDTFRKHIGLRENFGHDFGDQMNERWEDYVRNVSDYRSFMTSLGRNMELQEDSSSLNDTFLSRIEESLKQEDSLS